MNAAMSAFQGLQMTDETRDVLERMVWEAATCLTPGASARETLQLLATVAYQRGLLDSTRALRERLESES